MGKKKKLNKSAALTAPFSFTPAVVAPYSAWQRSESWITSDNFGAVWGGD